MAMTMEKNPVHRQEGQMLIIQIVTLLLKLEAQKFLVVSFFFFFFFGF